MKQEIIIIDNTKVDNLYNDIKLLVEESRNRVYKTVNTEMINLYWNIGKMIVDMQEGNPKAKYGDYLIERVSDKLSLEFGKGFSNRNIKRMRKFYLCYSNRTTLLSQLTWSHYLELIKIDDVNKRNFYMHECINSNWDVRELQRQRTTLLYERLLASKDKNKVFELSTVGHKLSEPKDIIKDPFVLEFLDIKENTNYLESDLEKNILNHLKEFLLELGKGFTYVGNQVRITLDTEHYYPDLVFYNRILKCFVIIDLKIGKVTHKDIGQMQMYVNYYDREIKDNKENKTIGILLSTDKNETIVKYTLPEDNQTIFSSEFRLTIPTEEEFINVIESEKKNLELV
ncbi:MAG: PDDEXK nuclease domain-containing protein [bacterium]|nr:PDDEXK nuclease domain-containing protein [bacterium]